MPAPRKAFTANLVAALGLHGPGSPLPKSCHQPSRPPPDMAARPGPTTARRSAVLMLGGLPAPTILEWF
jgi:hypothetical protein